MTHPIGNTAIIGIGQTEFSKNSGRSELQLAAEAAKAAIADAGLSPADIDGMVTFTVDSSDEISLARSLGMSELHWVARTPFGGEGASATVEVAAAAVASGAASAVLIYRAFNERSGFRFGQPMGGSILPPGPDFYFSYGLNTPAKIYSLWYQRYLQKYGVTSEDLGRYVVIAREYAATNPNAWYYGRPITLEEHQESHWIVEPILRRLDCCQESDGGVALVVTSAERAKDLPGKGVRILGAAFAHRSANLSATNYYDDDLSFFSSAHAVSNRLWTQTGLTPADVDVAMLYENFSPVVFELLEGNGFCGRGEAKYFIGAGEIRIDGKLPVNTHGGLLGEAYIHGVNNILEAVRQIRGTAANQVKDAEVAFVSSGGAAAILGKL